MTTKKYKGKFSSASPTGAHKKLVSLVVILSIFLIVSIVVLAVIIYRQDDTPVEEVPGLNITRPENTDADASGTTEGTAILPTTEPTTKPTMPPTDAPTTQPTEPPSTGPETQPTTIPTTPPVTTPPNTESTIPPTTAPPTTKPTEPEKVVLKLPYVVPGSKLVIQRVAPYDGIYLEDGSDETVTGVAMMLLYNAGTDAVEYTKITMKYKDKTLTFEASAIPAGGVVAVQEINRKGCSSGDLLECTADIATLPSLGKAENIIKIKDNGNNSLTVTNLSDKDIVTVRIFYKHYMEDANAYVGGITYTAKISNLKAKESIVITPSHYASIGSVVVMVRTYDKDA